MYFLSMSLFAQSTFFKNYDGIPIIANLWSHEQSIYLNHDFSDLPNCGVDAIVPGDLLANEAYNPLKSHVKIIPCQNFPGTRKGIVYYSERAYSVWEAEGCDNGVFGINLTPSGIPFNNIEGEDGYRSNGSSIDTLIKGPNLGQLVHPLLINTKIPYDINFNLLIAPVDMIPIPDIEANSDTVCIIQAICTSIEPDKVTIPIILDEKAILVSEFNNLNEWTQFVLSYNTNDKSIPESCIQTEYKLTPNGEIKGWVVINNVEFKVIWKGLSYLNLYVDKIVVSDKEGFNLNSNDFTVTYNIEQEVNGTADGFDPNYLAAWAPIDEPNSLDPLHCLSKLDEIIHSCNSNFYLYTAIAGCWNGVIKENVYKVDEFYKRANYKGGKLNNYIFNYPYYANEPGYQKGNISNLINNHLSRINKLDSNFMCSIQTGKWRTVKLPMALTEIPTAEQFMYNINVDLLYGAKGIEMNDFYYFYENMPSIADSTWRTSLVKVHADSVNNPLSYYTPLYYTLKDSVSPRLKGSYGKLLKKLRQQQQGEIVAQSNLTLGSIYFSRFGIPEYDGARDLDCGLFNMPEGIGDKKYFMIVSRYYQGLFTETSPTSINFECNNMLKKNYTVKEHYHNSNSYYCATNNKITFNKSLKRGSALLFEVMPTLKYGGRITVSDTVNESMTLSGDLEIPANKSLFIGDSSVYTISDTLIVKTNGSILNSKKGGIEFTGTGKIVFENWNNSLFYVNKEGHPKLIWGALSGNQVFNVYKKINGVYVCIAVLNSNNNNNIQSYVDTTVYINNGQLAGTDLLYKVGRLSGERLYYSNIVTVPVPGSAMDKSLEEPTPSEFSIGQNYPNPFNPSTTIRYNIPSTGNVSIKLFDMLGREVKDLFEGIQQAGTYDLSVNCSNMASGVYIYKIEYNDKMLSKKMILQK